MRLVGRHLLGRILSWSLSASTYLGHVGSREEGRAATAKRGDDEDPEYEASSAIIHVRAFGCSTLDEMVERATRTEDADCELLGSRPKRTERGVGASRPRSGGDSGHGHEEEVPLCG
ncbi:hypothetical protein Dimus_037677 [Dionaea muscipula]